MNNAVGASKELEPLTEASNRRDIHTRLVGPLATTALLHTIDVYRAQEDRRPFGAYRWARNRFERVLGRVNDEEYWSIAEQVFCETIEKVVHKEMDVQLGNRFYENQGRDDSYTTASQWRLYSRAVYFKTLTDFVKEGRGAQKDVTFRVALPAYLSAKDGLSSVPQIKEAMQQLGLEGVASMLRRQDFMRSLPHLALTANGLWGELQNKLYVDNPKIYPVLDVKRAIRKAFEDSGGSQYLMIPEDIPAPVSVFELFAKQPDGSCGLSKAARNALKYYLEYRNNYVEPAIKLGNVSGPSRGCPVVQASVRVCRDDYTERQWTDMLEGDNPIAEYNSDSQRLTFKRSAFHELSYLYADVLSGKVS